MAILPASPAEGAAATQPRGRLLVVDDDPLVGRALARILSPPHEVHVVEGGEAAIALVERGPAFDVVLCDVMMPRMTGIELYRHLATQAPALARRVVFLTGGAFTAEARTFLQTHANACVDKPVGALALRGLVEDLLRAR